ncbi:hypothetical protein ACFE04_009042 [Oxalis oulophora]
MAFSRISLMLGCFIVAISLLSGATTATQYTVGDDFGWNLPPNDTFYQTWANNKSFVVGDKLVFQGTGQTFADVSEEEYNNCTNPGLVIGVTTAVTYNFTKPGAYYFVGTVDDNCQQGQKFEVKNVTGNAIVDAPPAGFAPKAVTSFGGAFVGVVLAMLFLS